MRLVFASVALLAANTAFACAMPMDSVKIAKLGNVFDAIDAAETDAPEPGVLAKTAEAKKAEPVEKKAEPVEKKVEDAAVAEAPEAAQRVIPEVAPGT